MATASFILNQYSACCLQTLVQFWLSFPAYTHILTAWLLCYRIAVLLVAVMLLKQERHRAVSKLLVLVSIFFSLYFWWLARLHSTRAHCTGLKACFIMPATELNIFILHCNLIILLVYPHFIIYMKWKSCMGMYSGQNCPLDCTTPLFFLDVSHFQC